MLNLFFLSDVNSLLQLILVHSIISFTHLHMAELNDFVRDAIREDRQEDINRAFREGFDQWDIPLREYARKNNWDCVEFFLSLEPNYQVAAEGALEGNHHYLFNYIRSIAPPDYQWNWSKLDSTAI